MRAILTRLSVIIFFFALPPTSLTAKDDWQQWNMLQLKAKAHENLTLRLQGEQWLTNNLSRNSLNNVDAGFLWQPVSFFEVGPFYRYQYVDNLSGPNVGENRYYAEASLKHPLGRLKLSNRSRVELRETTKRNFWVYRNEIRAAIPFGIKNVPVSPYLSEEFFQRGDGTGINENRVSLGWHTQLHKHFGLTLFYLIRHTKGKPDWKSDQVLGSTLHISV